MKKVIFRLSIFILLIFNLTLLIIPTSARYISLDFGYVWNVLFSKYSVFADDFIIHQPTFDAVDNVYESDELWGEPSDVLPDKVQNFGDGYKIADLNNVGFTVRNNTDYEIALSAFIIELYMFKNSDAEIVYEITNSASTQPYEKIKGMIALKKSSGNTAINGFTQFAYTIDNSHDFTIVTLSINPLEYYKNVVLKDNVLNYDEYDDNPLLYDDNTLTPEEKINLEKYFVLEPGEVFEYNISVVNDINNGSTNHSVYASVKMTAKAYVPE